MNEALSPESRALVEEWEAGATRPKRNAQPEHAIQVSVHKFARECVAEPGAMFIAFDRSRKQSAMQHVREKARGLISGTADTVLLWSGGSVWIELKAPGNKPSDLQKEFGDRVMRAGHCHGWTWANSVASYASVLRAIGVPLRPNADVVAMRLDALLDSGPPKRSAKPRKASRPRAAKPTMTQVRRTNAVRSRVMF